LERLSRSGIVTCEIPGRLRLRLFTLNVRRKGNRRLTLTFLVLLRVPVSVFSLESVLWSSFIVELIVELIWVGVEKTERADRTMLK